MLYYVLHYKLKYILYRCCLVVAAAAEKRRMRWMMMLPSPHENWCRHFDKLGRRKVMIFGPLQHLSVSAYTYIYFMQCGYLVRTHNNSSTNSRY